MVSYPSKSVFGGLLSSHFRWVGCADIAIQPGKRFLIQAVDQQHLGVLLWDLRVHRLTFELLDVFSARPFSLAKSRQSYGEPTPSAAQFFS